MNDNNYFIYEDELVQCRVHGSQQTKKIADLQPIEVKSFLKMFLDQISSNPKIDDYYLKTILFYYCTTKNTRSIRKLYISKLKRTNNFNMFDKSKYFILLLRGQILLITKYIYRLIMNNKHRR